MLFESIALSDYRKKARTHSECGPFFLFRSNRWGIHLWDMKYTVPARASVPEDLQAGCP